MASKRYTALVLSLGAWLAGVNSGATEIGNNLADYAPEVLQHLHQRLVKLGKNLESLSDEARHDVRIAAKKLRYAAEFFSILYPGSSAHAYLVAVASLQDVLGTLNDVSVARKFACNIKARATDKRLVEEAQTISGWLEQRNQNWMLQLAPAWRTFRSKKQFWR